jgi:hypothetical protein
MGSPKFMIGAFTGLLLFGFVMFNIWLWDIIEYPTMMRFSSGHFYIGERQFPNSLLMAMAALAVMLAAGYVYAAIGGRQRKTISAAAGGQQRVGAPLPGSGHE